MAIHQYRRKCQIHRALIHKTAYKAAEGEGTSSDFQECLNLLGLVQIQNRALLVNDEAQHAMSPGQYFTPRQDNVCSFSAATCSYSQSHQHSTVRHTGRV